MKKLFVSLGLAAVGTAGLQAAYAPDSPDNSKMWSLSATLRGFYDDNYMTTPHKHGSFGMEASPSFGLNVPLQQTEIGLRYTYGFYYYQQRENNGQSPIDQTHQLDLWLDHAFSSRWEARVQDTVTVQQDPALTAVGTATPQRVNGNNLDNTVNASLHTDWTRAISTELSYQNSVYDYENGGGTALQPSYAGLLDRVEQGIGLDLQWHVSRDTTALVGYKFGLVNFTGNEQIAQDNNGNFYYSDSRDNRSHYGYVGVQHNFLDNLKGSANVGVQYTEYYNDPSASSSLGPYADASMIYTYASGSYMQLGVTQSRNATDTVQIDTQGHITQDQESTVVYGSINHPLTPKLIGSVVGHYQYSVYHNGQFNSQSADFYNLGLNLSYAFNRHFSSDIGYNFDWYTTPVSGQGYTRNRVYLGVTATY
jgi:hypothetical protein